MSQARNSDRLTLPVTQRDRILGSIDTTVVLVEYGDYQCLQCGQAYLIVKEIQRQLGDQLCFVFRHFPLTQIHPHAQNAAEAAEVAAAQGKFWQMHDTLFEHQDALDDAHLLEYALMLELDITQFLRDMSGDVYTERVREDKSSGVKSGVKGTPTFFINQVRHLGPCNLERLLAAIRSASNLH